MCGYAESLLTVTNTSVLMHKMVEHFNLVVFVRGEVEITRLRAIGDEDVAVVATSTSVFFSSCEYSLCCQLGDAFIDVVFHVVYFNVL